MGRSELEFWEESIHVTSLPQCKRAAGMDCSSDSLHDPMTRVQEEFSQCIGSAEDPEIFAWPKGQALQLRMNFLPPF